MAETELVKITRYEQGGNSKKCKASTYQQTEFSWSLLSNPVVFIYQVFFPLIAVQIIIWTQITVRLQGDAQKNTAKDNQVPIVKF